jgi:hypothetical protein
MGLSEPIGPLHQGWLWECWISKLALLSLQYPKQPGSVQSALIGLLLLPLWKALSIIPPTLFSLLHLFL